MKKENIVRKSKCLDSLLVAFDNYFTAAFFLMILGEFKLAAEQATSLVDTQQSVFLQPTNIVTSVHTTSLQLPYSTGHGAVIIM